MTRVVVARLDPDLDRWGRTIAVTYGRGYARVELDRDAWMSRHATSEDSAGVEVPAEFLAAVERCREAGIWRIWLSGAKTAPFTWGSGSEWITLFVPADRIKESVAALKTAELRGDLSRLERLTKGMAAPFESWLAPGERYLQMGIDFACTPAQFLSVLRGKAKELGLRLNGRVDGNGVWVRPQRSAQEKFLREAFPERYDREPDPYARHNVEPAPGRGPHRPLARPRTRTVRADGIVRHLDSARIAGDSCPCGWHNESSQHERQHVAWSVGILIPARTEFVTPIAVVDTMAPKAWRSLAYACARIAQRDGRYDFASFESPQEVPRPHEKDLRVYLLATKIRVIGYLSVTTSTLNASWDFQPGTSLIANDSEPRAQIGLIFVAKEWRRHAVAATLVRALAADTGVGVQDLAWALPFTAAGEALARSLSPGKVWIGS
jgi:hypothetical protein